MKSIYKPICTDDQLVRALEDTFQLPVEYARVAEGADAYFVYFRDHADRLDEQQYFSETLVVTYVSINAKDDLTYPIADVLTDLGLKVTGIDFDVIRLTDGQNFADATSFTCLRLVRREPANRRIGMITPGGS